MLIINALARMFMEEASDGTTGSVGGTAAPAAPVAPAAAPVTAPAPAAGVNIDAPAPANPAPTTSAFPETGRPGLDIFLNFLGTNGVTPDSKAFKAADEGDFSLLRAELAAKGVTGVDQMIALAEVEAKAMEGEWEAKEADTTARVTAAFEGNEEYMNEVLDWARTNAEDSERSVVNAMFDAGGLQAQAAALLLRELHQQAGGTTPERTAMSHTASPGGTSSGAVTAADYQAFIREGVRQHGVQFARSDAAIAMRGRIR